MLTQRKYYFLALTLAVIIIGYGFLDVTEEKAVHIVGYASTGAQECGCNKCHSIELNSCKGCHSSQSPSKPEKSFIDEEVFEDVQPEPPEVDPQDTNSDLDPQADPDNDNLESEKGNDEKTPRQKNRR